MSLEATVGPTVETCSVETRSVETCSVETCSVDRQCLKRQAVFLLLCFGWRTGRPSFWDAGSFK